MKLKPLIFRDNLKQLPICFVYALVLFIGSFNSLNIAYSQSLKPYVADYTSFSNSDNYRVVPKSNAYHKPLVTYHANLEGKVALVEDDIEVIEKRTINSKYFVNRRDTSKFYQIFSYGGNLHYKRNEQWVTIDPKLKPVDNGLFEAANQQEPVGLNAQQGMAFIETIAGQVNFNNWTLFGEKLGVETKLSQANWSRYTAGKDGLKIYDIFPGIDAEMSVERGAIKTNFIIRSNQFPAIEKLIFKDHFSTPLNLGRLVGEENHKATFVINDKVCLTIERAIAYPEKEASKNYLYLDYTIRNNDLSFSIDAAYLNKYLLSGNVIIDPLVSGTATLDESSILGSRNNGNAAQYCSYPLAVPTPPKAVFTDVSFQFGYYASAPSGRDQGFFSLNSGICSTGYFNVEDPAINNGPGKVSTNGNYESITSLLSCLPPPSCVSQDVTFSFRFYNTYSGGGSECNNTYVGASEPLIIKIDGRTIELTNITPPVTLCEGESVTLTADAKYGIAPYTYVWSTGQTTKDITVSPLVTIPYSVVITDQCGNFVTGYTTVNIKPTPVVSSVASNSPVCVGNQLDLSTPVVSGATYSWTGPDNFTSSSPSPTIANANALQSGIYQVIITVDGCSSVPRGTTVQINTLISPTVTIHSSTTVTCSATPVVFTAIPTNGGSSPVYQWKLNGNNVGVNSDSYINNNINNNDVIACFLTSNATCVTTPFATSNSLTMTVVSAVVPEISITASETTICAGTTVNFTALPVNGGVPIYQWKVNGVNAGLNSPTFSSSTLANNDRVSCLLTSSIACPDNQPVLSNAILMVVNPVMVPAVSIISTATEICAGEAITFTASAVNSGNSPKYNWKLNGNLTGISDVTYSSSTLKNADIISCQIIADAVGCYASNDANSNTITVMVNPLPVISAGRDTIVFVGSSFVLKATSNRISANYEWIPSTYLSNSYILNPVITPLSTTKYTLQAISSTNCEAIANITVKVVPKIEVMNTFTPNGDGINDTWAIKGLSEYDGASVEVYNRFGRLVFYTTVYKPWDGTNNGKPLPASTYYYIINPKNKFPLMSGWVVIAR